MYIFLSFSLASSFILSLFLIYPPLSTTSPMEETQVPSEKNTGFKIRIRMSPQLLSLNSCENQKNH